MRLQQIFELCATHLLNQKRRCVRAGCVYFGIKTTDEDGEVKQLRCGASPLLRDELGDDDEWLYAKNGLSFEELRDDDLKPEFRNLTEVEHELITSFQRIHDTFNYDPEKVGIGVWKKEIKELGEEYKCETMFLKNWDE